MDLLVTDPPYNVELGWRDGPGVARARRRRTDGLTLENDGNQTDAEFIEFLTKCFNAAVTHLKSGGAFYVWHAASHASQNLEAIRRAGLELKQNIYWIKQHFVLGRQDYQWQTEPCYYGWKDGAAHYFTALRNEANIIDETVDTAKLSKAELKSILDEIIESTPTDAIHEARPTSSVEHPTMKPVKLIARIIRNSSRRGENVLDIFGGSGTTLVAAEQLGRKAYIMEIDPAFCDVIIQRYENLTGNKAQLIRD